MATVLTPDEIKQKIEDWITSLGGHEITGAHLNAILSAIMDYVGVGFAFKGSAPAEAPSSDVPVVYIAGPGTYTGYENDAVEVPQGSMCIFKYDGSDWSKSVLKIHEPVSMSDDTLMSGGEELGQLIVITESHEYRIALADKNGHVALGVRKDGAVEINTSLLIAYGLSVDELSVLEKLNVSAVSTVLSDLDYIEHPAYRTCRTDINGKVVSGTLKDGSNYVYELKSESIERLKNAINEINSQKGNNVFLSPYYKNTVFGIPPAIEYDGVQTGPVFGGSATTTQEVYAEFDALVDDNYVTSEILGQTTGGIDVKLYRFKPLVIDAPSKIPSHIPTIMMIFGQHGFEKNDTYGFLYLIKDVINHSDENELLRYLRYNVEFIIVPVANPWGWNNNKYYNENGVNLNRNWWIPNWIKVPYEPDSSDYTGETPFDQPETAAIRDYILAHKSEINLFIDCHTNGYRVSHNYDLNWLDMTMCPDVNDRYFGELRKVLYAHAINFTNMAHKYFDEYLISEENPQCGHITYQEIAAKGWADVYAATQNILGCCIEVGNSFPASDPFIDDIKKCVAMIYANFIRTFCIYYSKF